jgi:hypothetical protein
MLRRWFAVAILIALCALPVAAQRRERGSCEGPLDRDLVIEQGTRLAAILEDLRNPAENFDRDTWRRSTVNAIRLADRVCAHSGGSRDAVAARDSVNEMQKHMSSDRIDSARAAARVALRHLYRLLDTVS